MWLVLPSYILAKIMGQKFSNLKGFFSAMDNDECTVTNREAQENQNLSESQDDVNNDSRTNEILNDNAGNNHFESIYGTAASLASVGSTSSSLQDKENGNVVEGQTQSEPCTPQVDLSLRRGTPKTLSFVSGKRSRSKSLHAAKDLCEGRTKKKRNHWVLKFNCTRLKSGCGSVSSSSETYIPEPHMSCDSCVCTGYRRTEEHHLGAGVVFDASAETEKEDTLSPEPRPGCSHDRTDAAVGPDNPINPVIDLSKFNPDDYPIEDCDERARLERAREIAEGVEPPPGFQPGRQIQLLCPPELTIDSLTALFQTHLGLSASALAPALAPALAQLEQPVTLPPPQRMVHTQVDYIHCLVPDLLQITSCSFYWGKMDRYEAERLLDGRPEGTFLLRDSAQEEYLFSVSFRKYGRSLHARIEQWNHRFSFDSHDPGVFASSTVCGLIEHYKDPSCCMFFEPMLTIPLHRNFPFSLQHLCRAVVSSRSTYDGVNQLSLPKPLKSYLKEYHYKQRVRVRRFDAEH